MLCANIQIADQAKIEGQEGKVGLGGGLQHRHDIDGLGAPFADGIGSCDYIPHAYTSATSLSVSGQVICACCSCGAARRSVSTLRP